MDSDSRFSALQKKFGTAPENEQWVLCPRTGAKWLVHKKITGLAVGECFQREDDSIVCLYRGGEGVSGNTPLEAVYNAWVKHVEKYGDY